LFKKKIIYTVLIFSIGINIVGTLSLINIKWGGVKYKYHKLKNFNLRNSHSDTPALSGIVETDTTAWYAKYNVVAHGGGGIDGRIYTNSKEAYELSYQRGLRVFDADLSLTSDSLIVCRHEWYDDLDQPNIDLKHIPSYEEFMTTKICSKYTPLDLVDLISFLEKHDDVYVSFDFKDNQTYIVAKLIEEINKRDTFLAQALLQRIVVTFFYKKEYYSIKEIYPFNHWVLKQYGRPHWKYEEIAEFCLENRINVCNVLPQYLDEGDNLQLLLDKGIKIYVAHINKIVDAQKYMDMGVGGFISDYLYEEDLKHLD
jgi:glycerophosphoryl diester phosphodiesterase